MLTISPPSPYLFSQYLGGFFDACSHVLLNTTSKKVAGVAAALTILSYVATAVVSAFSASQYLSALWEGCPMVAATIILLGLSLPSLLTISRTSPCSLQSKSSLCQTGVFALLNLWGISESAAVAVVLFVVHCLTLFLLVGFSFVEFVRIGWSQLESNIHVPPPRDLR